jgi:uncharacterized protein (DUF433 family)
MSQVDRGIVRELHDEPHLEGRRLTVRFLKVQVEDRGLDPQEVAAEYDLAIADVYRALAYYHDHPDEMRAVERRREATFESHEHLTTDPETVRN